ncbi:MAG: hypothetical protein ACI9CO_001341, partial [Candidatus Azotimanducaceae bacterium]
MVNIIKNPATRSGVLMYNDTENLLRNFLTRLAETKPKANAH